MTVSPWWQQACRQPDAAAEAFAIDFAARVVGAADAGGRPFGIIDKQAAALWVFDGA